MHESNNHSSLAADSFIVAKDECHSINKFVFTHFVLGEFVLKGKQGNCMQEAIIKMFRCHWLSAIKVI